MLCKGSTFAATVHRRAKVGETPRNGSNLGRRGVRVQNGGNAQRRVQRCDKGAPAFKMGGNAQRRVQRYDMGAPVSESGEMPRDGSTGPTQGKTSLTSCTAVERAPRSRNSQRCKKRVLINEEWPVWCERDAT
ncbi:hypothetical protein Y032_0048g1623 [Ancylostoma ceylanicum]|uniref:Uncharacterized protein n=1 Tax=Ancylostoma ceylanicum TaxID=53326 RepID=A0A016UB11_9BILA|nr:hypothetical protein Y032_0048g1623 [Ancylostoma ceylanicum]